MATDDLSWLLRQQEGQFFDRKSCFDRSGSKVKLRPVRDVARDVAETLAAMANADGGSLVLGIEDDGAVSGAPYPWSAEGVIIQRAASCRSPRGRRLVETERERTRKVLSAMQIGSERLGSVIERSRSSVARYESAR